VVPNRYPAVRGELGEHELIVECPNHEPSLEALQPDHVRAVLAVYHDRLSACAADGRWRYGLLFKNHGLAAGASLAHAHSQLLALPEVPPAVTAELAACEGACGFCSLIRRELTDGRRVVRTTEHFAALTAFAGRLPYETWLLPRDHRRSFEHSNDDGLAEFADLLTDVLKRLAAAAGRPAYNLYLHNAPWDGSPFHWHFELLPRLTGIAGFELGAGICINPLPPEDAAARLRAAASVDLAAATTVRH
jgi:UDPglucose--hexose-1-phosphate uridylyltransferase